MLIVHSYVSLPEGISALWWWTNTYNYTVGDSNGDSAKVNPLFCKSALQKGES